MNAAILEEITIDDIPGDLRIVARTCGLEVAARLMSDLPGITIYIPRYAAKDVMRRYIVKMYPRLSAKELALQLGVSDRYVYKCLEDEGIDERQTRLFDAEEAAKTELQPPSAASLEADARRADEILACVMEHFTVTRERLLGPGRSADVTLARHTAMYLLRESIPHMQAKRIGELFGGRDHSTVLNGITSIRTKIEQEPDIAFHVTTLRSKIGLPPLKRSEAR